MNLLCFDKCILYDTYMRTSRIQLARNMREMRNNTCDDKEIEKAQLMLHLLPRSAGSSGAIACGCC